MTDISVPRRVGIWLRRPKGVLSVIIWAFVGINFGFWVGIGAGLIFYIVMRWLGRRHPSEIVPKTSHGSARFAGNQDLARAGNLAAEFMSDRYVLGISAEVERLKSGHQASLKLSGKGGLVQRYRPLITTRSKFQSASGEVDDGHVVTVAGAGSGKGIAVVKPNLMAYEGPAVVLDPKGENFLSTAEARIKLGHRICLIDPFSLAPPEMLTRYQARFNPLDALEMHYQAGQHSQVFDEASAIAEMVVFSAASENQPHWNDKAKSFLKAALLFVTYAKVYQDRQKTPLNLNTVKTCILHWFQSEEQIAKFIERCQATPHITAMAGEVGMVEGRERSGVLSTLLRHTEFLNSPNVQESLSTTNFALSDLKTEKLTIYLVLPADRLKAYSRLARLWIGTMLQVMMADPTPPRRRVLFMLDEVAQLGSMEPLEQAVSLGRGYGLDIWMLFQDIHQMKGAYGVRWETFLANAKVQQFFGIQDLSTAEYIAKKIGQATIQIDSHSHSDSKSGGTSESSSGGRGGESTSSGSSTGWSQSSSRSTQSTGRSLMQPDEVMRLPEDRLLIFMAAQYPILAEKCSVLRPDIAEALAAVLPLEAANPGGSSAARNLRAARAAAELLQMKTKARN